MSGPIVNLTALQVQDAYGAVQGISLALPAGPIGALIGNRSDGTTALARAIGGLVRPYGGKVRISGKDPRSQVSVRKRVGVLLHEPDLPDMGQVKDLLVLARRLRGGEAARESWYVPLGLDALAQRSIRSLQRSEARALALGLALAIPEPLAIVLVDPLSEVGSISAHDLRQLLRARAQTACVLLLTSSASDAVALADDVATLDTGRIGRAIGQPEIEMLSPGMPVELLVWCDKARAFASALLLEPEVEGLTWGTSDPNSPARVYGKTLDGCARAVARTAARQGVTIKAMQPVVPSAAEVRAATAGVALAMRQNAAYAVTIDTTGRGAA